MKKLGFESHEFASVKVSASNAKASSLTSVPSPAPRRQECDSVPLHPILETLVLVRHAAFGCNFSIFRVQKSRDLSGLAVGKYMHSNLVENKDEH